MVTEKALKLFEDNNIYNHAGAGSPPRDRAGEIYQKGADRKPPDGRTRQQPYPPGSHPLPEYTDRQPARPEGSGLDTSSGCTRAAVEKLSQHIEEASKAVDAMVEARKKCNDIADTREKAIAYCTDVKEAWFDKLRYHADKLEQLVDDKEWSLPKYRELLFLR
jgi:glutamine synthetase